MVLLGIVLLLTAAIPVLYRYLTTKRSPRALWRSSVGIGSLIGVVRAVLACVGWYGVEHTGGWFQIPAFGLAMLAWPEAIVFGRHQGATSMSFYASLALLLIVSSVLLVSVVGLAVQVTRIRRDI
jgi:hypothetical protein